MNEQMSFAKYPDASGERDSVQFMRSPAAQKGTGKITLVSLNDRLNHIQIDIENYKTTFTLGTGIFRVAKFAN